MVDGVGVVEDDGDNEVGPLFSVGSPDSVEVAEVGVVAPQWS